MAMRNLAETLFESIDRMPERSITIDFSGVESITRSFAHAYSTRKAGSPKDVSEINVAPNIAEMLAVVMAAPSHRSLFECEQVRVVVL